jgi:transposase
MTIGTELEAQILRYYHVEKWRCGTIARQLHVHRGTVQRVLAQAGLPRIGSVQRPSQIDAYLPFILETLKKFPSLTASRLYAMVYERGYRGGQHHFRHLVSLYRPRPVAEAYLRLRTLPGEQSQCDWGSFGHLQIGRARRPLMAFVMVLSWSRQIYLRFFLSCTYVHERNYAKRRLMRSPRCSGVSDPCATRDRWWRCSNGLRIM